MKIPHALRQLMRQIEDHDGEESEVFGDPDGLGVYRSIKVSAKTAKWLGATLDVINDERIADIKKTKGGTVVTMVGDHRADFTHPFPLAEVDSILRSE